MIWLLTVYWWMEREFSTFWIHLYNISVRYCVFLLRSIALPLLSITGQAKTPQRSNGWTLRRPMTRNTRFYIRSQSPSTPAHGYHAQMARESGSRIAQG